MIDTVVVIAKQPLPGRVKTRLIGPCTATEAAELAAAALQDTFAALAELPCKHRVILLDGEAGDWLPAGWTVIAQVEGGLDERLSAGFDALPAGSALLVGMDTPQLQAKLLDFDAAGHDACLGLATDGGFWAIGFADPRRARECIAGVPMSTDDTGGEQLRRLQAAGLSVQLLATLTDVDTASTAAAVAAASPDTAFAQRWQAIQPAGAAR